MLVPPSGDRNLVDIKPKVSYAAGCIIEGKPKRNLHFCKKGRILVAGSLSPFDSDPLSVSPSLDPFSPLACF